MAAPILPGYRSLKSLVVYRSIIRPNLVRSVHVYRWDDGYEEDEERAFLFHKDKNYEESYMGRIFTANNFFNLYEQYEGRRNGLWVCILMFDGDTKPYLDVAAIPRILNIVRNRKLQSIPSLADELRSIFELASLFRGWHFCYTVPETSDHGNNLSHPQLQAPNLSTGLDLNSFPPESDNEENDQNGSG